MSDSLLQGNMSDTMKYTDSGRNLKKNQCNGLFKRYLKQQFVLLPTEQQDREDLNKYLCRLLIQLRKQMVWSMSQLRSEASSGVSVSACKTNTTLKFSSILASGTCKRCRKQKWRHWRRKKWEVAHAWLQLWQPKKLKAFGREVLLLLLRHWDSLKFFYMSMNFGMRSGHYACCVVICNIVIMCCNNIQNEQLRSFLLHDY